MVTPLGARSIARMRACLVSVRSDCFAEDRCGGGWVPRLGLTSLCVVVCAAALACLAACRLHDCDEVRCFELRLRIRISFGFAASPARTTEAPPRPLSRRGRIPERAYRPETGHTSALFEHKSQSFLHNLIADFRPEWSSGDANHYIRFWRKTGHAEERNRCRYWGQSGHGLLQCTCPLWPKADMHMAKEIPCYRGSAAWVLGWNPCWQYGIDVPIDPQANVDFCTCVYGLQESGHPRGSNSCP